jgi:hypothetical protein
MSRDQNPGQIHNIKTGNKSFQRVEQFRYLETALKNEECIWKEIKIRLKSDNCLLSFSAESFFSQFAIQNYTNSDIQKYNFFLQECEFFSLIVREERGMSVTEDRILRRIFGLKRDEEKASGENYTVRSFMSCTLYKILSECSNHEK